MKWGKKHVAFGGTIPSILLKTTVSWVAKSPFRTVGFVLATFTLFVFSISRLPAICQPCTGIDTGEDQKTFIAKHYGCFGHVEHRDKIYQVSAITDDNLALANKTQPQFDRVMQKMVAKIPGAHFYGSRVKGMERLKQKLDSWRTPSKIADYLGCRITVESHSAMNSVLVALGNRFDVVQHEDFLDGHAFKTGYRAIHTQLVGRRLDTLDGEEYWTQRPCKYRWSPRQEEHEWPLGPLSVEVQILPQVVEQVQHDYRWVYEKWRPFQMDHEAGNLHADKAKEREHDYAAMTQAYSEAAATWEK